MKLNILSVTSCASCERSFHNLVCFMAFSTNLPLSLMAPESPLNVADEFFNGTTHALILLSMYLPRCFLLISLVVSSFE